MRKVAFGALVFLILGLLAVAPPSDAASRVLRVTKTTDDAPDGCTRSDCSLREAITRSNQTRDVETIVLSDLTYTLSIPGSNEDGNATGDLDIRRPVTVKGVTGLTEISQTISDRVIHVRKGALRLVGVIVRDGNTNGSGGGIFIDAGGRAALSRSRVHTNTVTGSGAGGGIFALGPLSLTDSLVYNNDSIMGGGGIFATGTNVTMVRSVLAVNTTTIANSTGGGGIAFIGPGTLSVTDSTIDLNHSGYGGGGIRAVPATSTGPVVVDIRRSTLSNNTADLVGGGLLVGLSYDTAKTRVTVSDSTISGNSSDQQGGGVFCTCSHPSSVDYALLRIARTTITNNTADADNNDPLPAGGGISGSAYIHTIAGSILAGNHDAGQSAEECGHQVATSLGANVFEEPACASGGVLPTDVTVANASFLGPLQNNGGPSWTHAILNPADVPVDILTGSACGGTDQRGVPRPQGGGCDSGSYEYATCAGVLVNIVGTQHRDILSGTVGADGILGLGGNDNIFGNTGNDGLCGGAGNDRLDGSDDTDVCLGGADSDTFANCETKKQ